MRVRARSRSLQGVEGGSVAGVAEGQLPIRLRSALSIAGGVTAGAKGRPNNRQPAAATAAEDSQDSTPKGQPLDSLADLGNRGKQALKRLEELGELNKTGATVRLETGSAAGRQFQTGVGQLNASKIMEV